MIDRIHHRLMLCAVLSALIFSGAMPAQIPGPSGDADTLHVNSTEVLVDAVVTDKKGNIPRDLTAQNFKILEDGREQKITSFSFSGSGEPGRRAKRFMALVFDDDLPGFREAARRFVEENADPDLYIAVYARTGKKVHAVLPFTSNAARIQAALNTMQIGPLTAGAYLERNLRSPLMERVDQVAAEMAPIRGRKAMALFSIGIAALAGTITRPNGTTAAPGPPSTPLDREMLQTIDDCKKANVAVFGFNVNPQIPDSVVSLAEDKNLSGQSDHVRGTNYIRDLAEGTGGRYGTPSANRLASFLGNIATEQSDYYVLGYTPAAGAVSKNCHKLKVTVDRKGLDVEARDSYCTPGAPDSPLKPAEKALEARSASGGKGSVAVSMQATWFYASRNRVVGDVAMDIDAAAMRMKGKLEADLPVTILAYREDGSVAARFGDTLDLMFESQARLDEFRKTPYRYSNQITLQPGTYRVRVSAGVAERAFGSAEQTLKIAPWGGETLSASAVALARTDRPSEEVTAEIDSSLLVGLHRLVTKGREFLPMGGNVFRAHETGLFYVEVYDPQLVAGAAKNAAAPVLEVSVVDRAAGAQRLDSGPIDTREWLRPDSSTIPISMRIPSADLPPGAYTLELRIKLAEGGDEVARWADFEVQ
jgi:VWFA-related protein